jgi:hypothetical protein
MVARVYVATNCILMCFWATVWVVWFDVVPFADLGDKWGGESKLCKHMDS